VPRYALAEPDSAATRCRRRCERLTGCTHSDCQRPVLVKARGAAADGLVRARSLLSRCRRAAQDSPADRRFPSAGPATGARARLATAAACSQRSALRNAIKKSTRTVDWTISSRCHRCGSGYRSSRKPTPGSLAWPRWCSASRRPRRVPASAERSRVEQGSSCAKRRALRRAMPIIFGVVGMARRARVPRSQNRAQGDRRRLSESSAQHSATSANAIYRKKKITEKKNYRKKSTDIFNVSSDKGPSVRHRLDTAGRLR